MFICIAIYGRTIVYNKLYLPCCGTTQQEMQKYIGKFVQVDDRNL